VNARTKAGLATPLHRAAFCGHIRVIDLLLNAHAEINARDADGHTPLKKAQINNQNVTEDLLKSRGGTL